MHTWLILASLFGVAFTKAVNPAKDTEGVCNVEGIQIRVGEKYQPPGKCYLKVCDKATYHQGKFQEEISEVTCPTVGTNSEEEFVPPVPIIRETYPECCHNPVSDSEE
ncbi:hypothetical protein GE061_019443 [Apolygus lucorum]|uniref:Single domain-containing protein n=1 Tax=Apolygus lucorum TaxID=248454 RepID=A0A6A4JR48_APOLU|nr:hypothetical protein GE061_019443 [Apolygus lucorum]